MDLKSGNYPPLAFFFGGMLVVLAHKPAWIAHWHLGLLGAIVALGAWIISNRRYRSVADTPTARIASAAQGYSEITGIGRALEGTPLVSPFNGLPCLWYRIEVERKNSKGGWQRDYIDQSNASFILDDGSGRCVVDPEHANVISTLKDIVTQSDCRTTQWLLIAGTRIYALGQFVTHSASVDRPAISAEVRDKLANWKETGETKRFDLDNDGTISQQEWELARAAAKREVEKERSEANYVPDLNMLGRPPDGRAFIISDMPPDKLRRRYRLQSWGWLALFFVALTATAWLRVNLP